GSRVSLTAHIRLAFFFLLIRPPPSPTLFPYTTLFRSTRAPGGRRKLPMSRCLSERTLMRLIAGGGREAQRAHLAACDRCEARYRAIGDALDRVREVLLHTEPPLRSAPLLARYWMPAIAAAVASLALLVWVEITVWRAVAAAALLTSGSAVAQPAGRMGGGGGPMSDGAGLLPLMLRSTKLTPEQDAKVKELVAARRAVARSLMQQLRQSEDDLAGKLLAPG